MKSAMFMQRATKAGAAVALDRSSICRSTQWYWMA
jgi:hypothetical protein